MTATTRRVLLGSALAAPLALMARRAGAQVAPTVWRMTTDYPASSVSGLGLSSFVETLPAYSGGFLRVAPGFESAITSGALPEATLAGRVEGGDAFAGPLEKLDPVFALPSLPFSSPSIDAAIKLNLMARPFYQEALARRGLKLLFFTVWPATGLWSKHPVSGPDDLRALKIRAYDRNSAAVMQAAGAKAEVLPFGETIARLKTGDLNAVLTSGDGGAGRKLWDYLGHFTAINYAVPISVAFMRGDALTAPPPPLRERVMAAAAETQQRQIARLGARTAENYAAMRAQGVTIADPAPAALAAHLKAAARRVIADWRAQAAPDVAVLAP